MVVSELKNALCVCAGVESALWSLLLSLAICVAAVSVFTAHLLLLLPILLTILGKDRPRDPTPGTQAQIIRRLSLSNRDNSGW